MIATRKINEPKNNKAWHKLIFQVISTELTENVGVDFSKLKQLFFSKKILLCSKNKDKVLVSTKGDIGSSKMTAVWVHSFPIIGRQHNSQSSNKLVFNSRQI